MNQAETNNLPNELPGNTDELTIFDLFVALSKRKRLLVRLPLITAVLAGAVSFALPNVYKATTQLVPPQQSQGGASALLSQLGGMAGAAAGVAGLKSPNDLYVGMLKSRTVADRLIEKFHLKSAYDTDSQDKARKILERNTNITAGKDGLIVIEVEDHNQKIVAPMANAYVTELLRLSKTLAVTEGAQRRVFFERQLEIAKNNLANSEVNLKKSLDAHGVIAVDVESKGLLETSARLKAQVSAKEIELNSMRAFVTTSNPNYRRVEEELASLKAELSRLETGNTSDATETSTTNLKGGLDNIRLLRDLKYNQMLYELLAKQYELARLDEAKDPSIVQVLDPAVEPEHKEKPQRVLIVFGAAVGGLLLAILWAVLSDMKRRAFAAPNAAARLGEIKANLQG